MTRALRLILSTGDRKYPPYDHSACCYATGERVHNHEQLSRRDLEPEPERVYVAEGWPRLDFP